MTSIEMSKKLFQAIKESDSENITLDKKLAYEIVEYLENIKDIRNLEEENCKKRMQEFKDDLLENVASINIAMMKTILDKNI